MFDTFRERARASLQKSAVERKEGELAVQHLRDQLSVCSSSSVESKEHFMSSCLSTYLIIYLSDNLFMQVESSKLATLEKTYKALQSKHEQQMSVLLGQVRVERREIESSREELVRCQQLIRSTVAQMASQRDDLQCQVESLKAMQQVMVRIDGWVGGWIDR